MILHCVFCRFRAEVETASRSAIVADILSFARGLDGVADARGGPNIDVEGKSPEYSHGFVIRFVDAAALAAYAAHPTHRALGARLCGLCAGGAAGVVVYDLQDGA